jgi:alpha-1,4-N-acetylglucosaminyltransferase EXTL3
MVLTNAAFVSVNLLRAYSEPFGPAKDIREHVDSILNCEDLAMNFIAAATFGSPPVTIKLTKGMVVSDLPHPYRLSFKCESLLRGRPN